jgi:bifunctional non-homologous end joining protein LigD
MDGNWLLIKKRDEEAGASRKPDPQTPGKESVLRIGSREIALSHLDKEYFPGQYTKEDVIDYYRRIAPVMLPHLRGRPVSMQRYPDGITGQSFFQKEIPDYFPEWISRATFARRNGGRITHVLTNDVATLVYLAGQGCLVPHVWLSRADKPEIPDRLIFDLDPPDAAAFSRVKKAAFLLRDLLEDELGLVSVPMLTGSRGVHVLVPLRRRAPFDRVRALAGETAAILVRRHPDLVTVEHRKAKRGACIYLDVGRNAYGQTAVPPYSLRALPGAPVATPVTWEELRRPGVTAQSYTLANIQQRLSRKADPWKRLPTGQSADAAARTAHRIAG